MSLLLNIILIINSIILIAVVFILNLNIKLKKYNLVKNLINSLENYDIQDKVCVILVKYSSVHFKELDELLTKNKIGANILFFDGPEWLSLAKSKVWKNSRVVTNFNRSIFTELCNEKQDILQMTIILP